MTATKDTTYSVAPNSAAHNLLLAMRPFSAPVSHAYVLNVTKNKRNGSINKVLKKMVEQGFIEKTCTQHFVGYHLTECGRGLVEAGGALSRRSIVGTQ